ncbi:hypothetical protein CDAR_93991 [Caerostris darwini]|uniref:Uncharacterized protein n=1 Tax=Caerostris darwini TaxID=1538125 RepID=A0AAV4NK80_9ARAC|nr:hypothetical protein CDAR_93991 [Caerostris darwini]
MWKTVAKLSLSHYPTPHARVHLHGVMVVKQSKKVHHREKNRGREKKPEDLQEMPLFQVIFTSAALSEPVDAEYKCSGCARVTYSSHEPRADSPLR